jgi:hypothetical protein
MPKELSDFVPEKFDLHNRSIPIFFSEVAISLDSHRLGKSKEDDYKKIYHVAEILRDKSRDFRTGKENYPFDNLFFWKFYGGKKEESDVNYSRGLFADRLLILRDKLLMIKDLSKEEIEGLEEVCVRLSKETLNYLDRRTLIGTGSPL